MSVVSNTTLLLNSGHNIPVLGLGTWKSKLGEVGAAVEAAIDIGYRHFDCAYIYQNEAEIGAAIKKKLNEGFNRKEFFVTSKLWQTQHEAKDVRPALLHAINTLQVGYLDLFLIHAPMAFEAGEELYPRHADGRFKFTDVHFMETWVALEECVDEGLVNSIGLSNFNSLQVDEVITKGRIKPAVLQVEVHPYLVQNELVDFCKQRGVVVTGYSPFASPDRPSAKASDPKVLEDPVIVEIARKCKKSPAQVCIRWQIQRGITVIPKSTSTARLKENSEVFDFHLSDEDMAAISSLNKSWRACLPKEKKPDGTEVPIGVDHYLYPYHIPY